MPPRPRRNAPRASKSSARNDAGGRRIVTGVDDLTFAAGWRHTRPSPPTRVEGIRVDLIRPDDLVALACTFVGCDLEAGGSKPPTIVPRGRNAKLVVEHAFQHAAEEAIFETTSDPEVFTAGSRGNLEKSPPGPGSTATSQPGAGFVPARHSRVVFALGVTPVEFTTRGILDAMTRLPLVLADLAKPGGTAPTTGTTGGPIRIALPPVVLHLGSGLVAELSAEGPVIRNATRQVLASHPAPDADTVEGALTIARNLRTLRLHSVGRTPVVAKGTRLPAESVFRPGRGITVAAPPERLPGRLRRPVLSEPPALDLTAIEAPYRLVVSPTEQGRFAHAVDPVPADDAVDHVELWHSRLANEPTTEGGPPNEHDPDHRVIRALWARDRDWAGETWKDATHDGDAGSPLSHPDDPTTQAPGFLTSLDGLDRHMIVRQTSETWLGSGTTLPPVPVGARALWLSSLGAWLDLHGAWNTKDYSTASIQALLAWDHVAPLGRDQYVRVVYPGYLFPFGHQAALIKLTERKIKTATQPYAGLYQRMFIVIGERTREYPQLDLPFGRVDIRPLVTPNIDFPGSDISHHFFPRVANKAFEFTLETLDKDGRPARFRTPLLWVNEADSPLSAISQDYDNETHRILEADGQSIGFVRKPDHAPDSTLLTERIWLRGQPKLGGDSVPSMLGATVRLPAAERISPTKAVAIAYRQEFVADGLGAAAVGNVWARVVEGTDYDPNGPQPNADPTSSPRTVGFGASGAGSDKAGGFLSPDLPIRGISAATGPVGDIAGAVTDTFNPAAFLAGALPKLFGLIDLVELLDPNGGTLPALVTDTLGRVQHFVDDVTRLVARVADAQAEAEQMLLRAQSKGVADLEAKANQALSAALAAQTAVDDLLTEVGKLPTELATDPATLAQQVLDKAPAALSKVRGLAPQLTPLVRDQLLEYAGIVEAAVGTITDLTQAIQDFRDLVEKQELSFHLDWRPRLQNWPASHPVFTLKDPHQDNLVLAVEGRVSATGDADVTVLAEIRDFSLTLFGEKPLMRVPFDHLSFKAGTTGKTEVDVVLGTIEFLGLLSFVETIKDLIPLDGFSDPPFMEVDQQGATAGFTLALPSVAIGVFNLSNMSLGADVSVPFLGKSVTVGFNFCSRERPFTLTVMCLGGGGWFLIRVAPDGLDVLEVGLEATAALAVDFGVASGSISAAIGIYIRLEGEKGSLTGYFRLRGEVDVLGLISASIELYMELVYQFDTGKMIGRATITVEIDVLFFSGSVHITAERQFAGSNGDPSFREVLGADDGTSPYWTDYCAAFAPEAV